MKSVFLGNWENFNDVCKDFEIDVHGLHDCHIILASYHQADYEGRAFVLYRQGDRLYEVNGSHCSCYGLEGQWQPEETSLEAIKHRLVEGYLGYLHDSVHCEDLFNARLKKILDIN